MTSAGCPPPSYLSLEENEDVTIIVHLTRMYGEVLLIAPVSVLLAFKVVKEIAIGVGGGASKKKEKERRLQIYSDSEDRENQIKMVGGL